MYDTTDGLKAGILKDVPLKADNKTELYCKEKDFIRQLYATASGECGYGICNLCRFK